MMILAIDSPFPAHQLAVDQTPQELQLSKGNISEFLVFMGVFHLQKNSEIYHWEFPLRKARSICHKSHSREARPFNRPRKAWNW